MNPTSTLASVGAMGGIAYSVAHRKSFWTTVGFSLLFALAGAAVGVTYQAYANE